MIGLIKQIKQNSLAFLSVLAIFMVFFGSFSSSSRVYVSAQPATTTTNAPNASGTTSNVAGIKLTDGQGSQSGFKDCSFNFKDASSSNDILKKCVQSVIRFVLVVGLFTLVFRIAFVAIMSVGGGSASAEKAVRDAVSDILIGFLLVGAPGLIIYTVNPAALNLSVLNLGSIANISNSSGVSGVGGSDTGTATGVGGGKVSFGNVSSSTVNTDLQNAVTACTTDPTITECKAAVTNALTLVDQYNQQCKNLPTPASSTLIKVCNDVASRMGQLNQLAQLKDKVPGGVSSGYNSILDDLTDCLIDSASVNDCVLPKDYQVVDTVGNTYNPRPGSYYINMEPFGGGKPGERVGFHFEGSGCSQNAIVKEFEYFHNQANKSGPRNRIGQGSQLASENCGVTKT